MRFLKSLSNQLMERDIQTLAGGLESIVARLDRGKLSNLLIHLEQDCNQLYDKQSAAQRITPLRLDGIFDLDYFSLRKITDEDLARWREAYKSKVVVVISRGKVGVMPASEAAEKLGIAISQKAPVTKLNGCIVLTWERYKKLLDEISKLTG
ncbi:hypothetical protein ACFLWE_00340 [Chloroflexota bacterium]